MGKGSVRGEASNDRVSGNQLAPPFVVRCRCGAGGDRAGHGGAGGLRRSGGFHGARRARRLAGERLLFGDPPRQQHRLPLGVRLHRRRIEHVRWCRNSGHDGRGNDLDHPDAAFRRGRSVRSGMPDDQPVLRSRIGHLRGRGHPCHDGRWDVMGRTGPSAGHCRARRDCVPGCHGVLRRRGRRHYRYDRRIELVPAVAAVRCGRALRHLVLVDQPLRRRRIRQWHSDHSGHDRQWCDLDAAERTVGVDVCARRGGLSVGKRLLCGRNGTGRRGPAGHD